MEITIMSKEEDIYENRERVDFEDEYEDDYYQCFGCGWYGNDPFIVKEYGMEWCLCPACSSEVI
jgi:hypothetical protein